jgi:predicted permease
MTVAEIALAVTLVAGAGWLVRAFADLRTADPGFSVDGRITFDVTLRGAKFQTPQSALAGFHDLTERVRGLAGVTAVGTTTDFPLRAAQENAILVDIIGAPIDPARLNNSRQRNVGPGFFDTMGITLVAGRDFNDGDAFKQNSFPSVAIVNRAFAKRYLSGRDPIGARFNAGYPVIDPRSTATVVGMVEDVRQRSLADAGEPAYYTSLTQSPSRRQSIVVKTALVDPAPLEAAIRDEVRKIDPNIPVDFELASGIVAATIRRQQLGMTLMLIFGATAVTLAAIGIYGVIAYATSQRRSEIATRLALGATPGQVFRLVLSQGRTLTLIGAAIGLGIAYLAGRVVSNRLYAVRASDPFVLGAAVILVAGIALLATTIPAFRSSRLDASRVLRPD